MNNIGEKHRHLLVLRRLGRLFKRRTALVAELRFRWQFGAARPAGRCRRQRAATIPAGVHVNIVSPLISGVRHIAMRSVMWSLDTVHVVYYETIFS
jgi:hypothetical protein